MTVADGRLMPQPGDLLGAITLQHPDSGAVLARADTEEEAATQWEALGSQGDYPVVLGSGGILVAIDPAAGVPDCDEDDARAFQCWRARSDALASINGGRP